MKRFLSIVLSVMMILSSVSFAVPSAVNSFDTSAEMITSKESKASLSYSGSWTDADKGDLLYAVTFDDLSSAPSGFGSANNNGVGNTLVTQIGTVNPAYADSLTGTTIGCRSASAMSVVTETNGNKYLDMTVNDQASIITYDFFVGEGTYTFEYDYIADGTDGIKIHSTGGYEIGTPVCTTKDSTWKHMEYTFDASSDGGYVRTRLNSSTVKMGIDNIKVYYKDPDSVVTPPSENTGATVTLFEVTGENLKAGYSLSGFGSSDSGGANAPLVNGIVEVNPDYASYLSGTRLGCRTATNVSVETEENGNKFIRLVTNARASIIARNFYVDAGKYTFEYDFKADGESVPAVHTPDELKAFTPEITTLSNGWKHFKLEFDITSDCTYVRTYLSDSTVNFDVDNVKMTYFDKNAVAGPETEKFTVTLDSNGNGAVENVLVSDVEIGTEMAVSDLVARIDTSASASKQLLGISETADGEVLSGNVTINADKTYYMIWKDVYVLSEIDWLDATKGHLLYTVRVDDMKADADLSLFGSGGSDGIGMSNISETAKINPKFSTALSDTLLGCRSITSVAVAVKTNGDKYLNVVASRPSFITRDFYVGEGTYTFEYDYQVNNTYAPYAHSPTALTSFTPVITDLDNGWMNFSLAFDVASDIGFARTYLNGAVEYFNLDNVKLYYKPNAVTLTLDANGNTDIQNIVSKVEFGKTYTVSELMALVDTTATSMQFTGISSTATGAAMSTAQSISIYEDTTLYLKWRTPSVSDGPIKNVIFMIPDGAGYGSYDFANDVKMAGGISIGTGTQYDNTGMTLRDYHVGSSNTLNFLGGMTDSGAGGTALSSGQKTRNLFLGLSKNNKPIASVLEAAQVQGKSTGIVSTYEWTHATPGSFTAHALDRSNYNDFYR